LADRGLTGVPELVLAQQLLGAELLGALGAAVGGLAVVQAAVRGQLALDAEAAAARLALVLRLVAVRVRVVHVQHRAGREGARAQLAAEPPTPSPASASAARASRRRSSLGAVPAHCRV